MRDGPTKREKWGHVFPVVKMMESSKTPRWLSSMHYAFWGSQRKAVLLPILLFFSHLVSSHLTQAIIYSSDAGMGGVDHGWALTGQFWLAACFVLTQPNSISNNICVQANGRRLSLVDSGQQYHESDSHNLLKINIHQIYTKLYLCSMQFQSHWGILILENVH